MAINIGFIGPGIMGGPMALNLMKGGHKLWVYARRPEAARKLVEAGAVACPSAAEVAKSADVIFLIVSDTPDVDSVIFGEAGLASTARRGSVIVDMSTISPTATKVFAERLAKQGVDMLDAPVSGGEAGAINGTLSIMVGGKAAVFERVKPLFELMGKNIVLVGENGSGQVAKACNQIVVAVTIEAVSEALRRQQSHGSAWEAHAGQRLQARLQNRTAPERYAHRNGDCASTWGCASCSRAGHAAPERTDGYRRHRSGLCSRGKGRQAHVRHGRLTAWKTSYFLMRQRAWPSSVARNFLTSG
jgi:3-hydroxyisobutyrate dehydrogenase-like beta-hydroxyacid dehydrogenase